MAHSAGIEGGPLTVGAFLPSLRGFDIYEVIVTMKVGYQESFDRSITIL